MIPYGYRIVDGKAVADDISSSRLLRFYKNFLSGLPMSAAAKEAGLPVCPSLYPSLFYRAVYIGTDFYPAIMTPSYQLQLQAEYERRRASSNQGRHKRPKKTVPIHMYFRLRYPAPPAAADPVQSLYDRIKPINSINSKAAT